MPMTHAFGGTWTETKLEILKGYLRAYSSIFAANEKARFFNTFYVDAFAGSGYIHTGDQSLISEPQLFEGFEEDESQEFLKGSAVCALEVEPPFKNYLFIEHSAARCAELENLKVQFPDRARSVKIQQGDANEILVYRIGSNGALSPLSGSPVPAGSSPYRLTLNAERQTPNGRSLIRGQDPFAVAPRGFESGERQLFCLPNLNRSWINVEPT